MLLHFLCFFFFTSPPSPRIMSIRAPCRLIPWQCSFPVTQERGRVPDGNRPDGPTQGATGGEGRAVACGEQVERPVLERLAEYGREAERCVKLRLSCGGPKPLRLTGP